MDDPHCRQQLEELAELFLTSLVQDQTDDDQADDDTDTDADADADDPLEGPAPIKLAPKIKQLEEQQAPDTSDRAPSEAADTPRAEPATTDPPPRLRLTEDDAEDEQPPSAQASAQADSPPDRSSLDSASDVDLQPIPVAQPGRTQTTSDAPSQTDAAATQPAAEPAASAAGSTSTPNQQPAPPAEDRPAPRALVEAVLLGNLPGMSGPWLTQYAQLLAQTDGPVALLHISGTGIDLELVEPRAEAQPAPAKPATTVRIPPMRPGMSGLVGLLDALVTADAAPARNILVRIDTPGDTRTLNQLATLHDWTVLCGADYASVNSVARQIRALVHADPRLADRHVALMVMGSDQPAAQQTAERVASELEQDLAQRVELIGHLQRMQPVQVRDIGTFPLDAWPQLAEWFDTLEAPEPIAPEPAPQAQATTPTRSQPQPDRQPQTRPAQPRTDAPRQTGRSAPQPRPRFTTRDPQPKRPTPKAPPRHETPTASQHDATTHDTDTHSADTRASDTHASAQRATGPAAGEPQQPTRPAPPRPKAPTAATPTRVAPRPRVLSPQPELDLAALLGQGPAALDDPVTLDARIPDQPATQLAVDAEGVVHVLLQHTHEKAPEKGSDPIFRAGGSESGGSDADAVVRLIEAGRWVRDNLELIALTQRDRGFVDNDPVLHLLTDRADTATGLVGKLGNQVRLHLLQQVQLGRESGWFCTPLG